MRRYFLASQELSRTVFWLGIFLDQDFVNCTSGTLPAVTQFGANLVIGCGPGEPFKALGPASLQSPEFERSQHHPRGPRFQ
jgi:hypothetical protein